MLHPPDHQEKSYYKKATLQIKFAQISFVSTHFGGNLCWLELVSIETAVSLHEFLSINPPGLVFRMTSLFESMWENGVQGSIPCRSINLLQTFA